MTDKTFRLVTVNTAPERAKRLIGRVVEDVKDKYTIVYVANVESKRRFRPSYADLSLIIGRVEIEDVKATVEREQPNLLASGCEDVGAKTRPSSFTPYSSPRRCGPQSRLRCGGCVREGKAKERR